MFHLVRTARSRRSNGEFGLIAQRESVRLTRGRSLVRSQLGPLDKMALTSKFLVQGHSSFGAQYPNLYPIGHFWASRSLLLPSPGLG